MQLTNVVSPAERRAALDGTRAKDKAEPRRRHVLAAERRLRRWRRQDDHPLEVAR